ncbi:MAG: Glu-tRNA(Gln) amidotransferase subunit GatE [Nanoarchaeota archaeon]
MELDYKELGFRCGLEIHQQLEGKKLFCSCPTEIRKDKPDFTVTRRLRASAGETGEVDKAAKYEQAKQKLFVYQGYQDSTCLVELDEEPPHELNKNALKTAVQVILMLNARPVEFIQYMRKVVIDGSNTSGFQRTALVGRNGYIELENKKKIHIPGIYLEEEACQVIKREKEYDIYNLSRLGIPLLEIATDPDLSTPQEAMEAAAKIGMILRSVEGMKRGIGTIRQDVNISISGQAKVEIKGFQEYKSIPKVIEYELKRQLELIKKGKPITSEVRNAKPDFTTEFLRPNPGADRMYPETDVPIIKIDFSGISAGKTLAEKEKELMMAYNLTPELAKELLRKKMDIGLFVNKYKNIKPSFIAETLITTPKEIKARFKLDVNPIPHVDEIFRRLDAGEIGRKAVLEILVKIAKGEKVDYSQYALADESNLKEDIKKVISKNPGASIGALMGMVMDKHRGKVDGKKVMELIKMYLQK